jgi:hypothetical protein
LVGLACDDLLDIYILIGLEQLAAAERHFDRIEAKVSCCALSRVWGYRVATGSGRAPRPKLIAVALKRVEIDAAVDIQPAASTLWRGAPMLQLRH